MRTSTQRVVHPLAQLQAEVGRLFDDVFAGPRAFAARRGLPVRAFPALNVWQEGDLYVVEAELPGVKRDDLDISVQGDALAIKGRRLPSATADEAYHRRERSTGEFSRSLTLPAQLDPEQVEASLADGVLTIRLPKAADCRARKIDVKTT